MSAIQQLREILDEGRGRMRTSYEEVRDQAENETRLAKKDKREHGPGHVYYTHRSARLFHERAANQAPSEEKKSYHNKMEEYHRKKMAEVGNPGWIPRH